MGVYTQRIKGHHPAAGKNICPECRGVLEMIGVKNDRVTSRCRKCNAEVTTLKAPPGARKPPKSPGGVLVRDRSSERKETPKKAKSNTPEKSQLDLGFQKEVSKDKEEPISIIRKAMSQKRLLSFQYISADGNTTQRTVEPYKLSVVGGKIILHGYCVDKEGIRSFLLGSISGCQVQPFSYEPKWPIEDLLDK